MSLQTFTWSVTRMMRMSAALTSTSVTTCQRSISTSAPVYVKNSAGLYKSANDQEGKLHFSY